MSSRSEKPSILIIDDDALSLDLLTVLLEAEGYPVQQAACGNDAIGLLGRAPATLRPAVILADLHMPGLCGNGLAVALREASASSVRLFAMSATQPSASTVHGYDAFLLKPFSPQDLAHAIQHEVPAAVVDRTAVPSEPQVLDGAIFAKLRSVMSPEGTAELYNFCLADARTAMGQMRDHLDRRDNLSFRERAHAIKGSCGMLGANELRSLAAEMEDTGLESRSAVQVQQLLNEFMSACDRLQRALKSRNRS